ncbi:MAG TPA: addiction module protein [Longimicrobium sp.]|nr:addiction module protein [Longimicrobium sp.]
MSDRIQSEWDTATDRQWAEELRRRIQAVESGEMKLISQEEADAEVELLLAENSTGSADQPPLRARG